MAEITLLEALLLGVLQGVTEWLPISSDGHLALAQAVLGVGSPVFFDAVLHLGTLVVVVAYFRRDVAAMTLAMLRWPRDARAAGSWRAAAWSDPARGLALLVILGTLPIVVAGFLLRPTVEAAYGSPLAAAVGLLVTGTYLWTARKAQTTRAPGDVRPKDAILIGLAQSAAIFPGVSRSGGTITTALLRGMDAETAARYSFLLAIPAILGAVVLVSDEASLAEAAASPLPYLVGFVVSAVVGWGALALLLYLVKRRAFYPFAWYCWALGGAVVAWELSRFL